MKEYKWLQLDVNSYHGYQNNKEVKLPFSEYVPIVIQDVEKEGWHLHTYNVSGEAGNSGFTHFLLFDREKDL